MSVKSASTTPSRRIREAAGDRVFLLALYAVAGLVALITLYPLLYVLSASFSGAEAIAGGKVYLWPVHFSLEGYRLTLREKDILIGFQNSVLYTAVGTSVNMILTILLAYPLSRKQLPGRNLITFIVAFTMYFSGGLIPTFLIVDALGLVDTIWGLLAPTAVSTFNTIIMRTYFQSAIPTELQESAELDGCNHTRFLTRIVLPLSAPILAVIALYYGVGHWNGYFNALIYLRSSSKINLQLALRNILLANQISGGETSYAERAMIGVSVKYCAIVISCIPMMAVYPFVQRFFIRGVMVGALKG
ncbi:MAG TPA: carbohydrate ABC transporter permease [Clostridia bacterium]|nr:carbohydrate ABC transporter permease [Clostridia bacterium]